MTSAGDGPAGASGGDGSAGASGGDGTAVAGDERTAGAHGDGRVGVVVAAGARRRRWVRTAVWLVVGVCAWVAVTRLVGAVDWSAVADAFAGLPVLVVVPLLLALLLRQTLNAVPLTYYVPGLALRRSMQNDLTANVVATFTPPPADIVVRVAMFRSWGVDPTAGMAGVTLNTAKFYAVRFLAPTLGLLLLVWGGVDRRQWVVAVVCGLVAAVMLTALVLLLRGDHLAAWLGRTAARLVALVRRGRAVDPDVWAATMVEVRARSSASLRRGLLPSMVALVGMVLADGLVLLVALRACGVTGLSVVDVLGSFLLVYPLTLFPLFGLGLLDALLVGAWTTAVGVEQEAAIVAATIVWRVVTILGTLVLGLACLVAWRSRHRGEVAAR